MDREPRFDGSMPGPPRGQIRFDAVSLAEVIPIEGHSGRAGQVEVDGVRLDLGNALDLYETWPTPTVIVSDGPYGLSSYPGDPPTTDGLVEEYRPHVEAWSAMAQPSTTLWFWNSELGWATVHPLLVANGWEYRSCHVWNKGIGHVAGNANTRTLRKFPVVTEVCVQYVRANRLPLGGSGEPLPLKQWLRAEWQRSGLPLSRTNEACGVRNAATRKYFTQCHLWYFPPAEAFVQFAEYANRYGRPEGRPYFSADGERTLTGDEWEAMRAKFKCLFGINNVWDEPPVRGTERIRNRNKALHMNQKPLRLIEIALQASSDAGDVVWEPFGGTATTGAAAIRLGRRAYVAEMNPTYFGLAADRLRSVAGYAATGDSAP